MRSFTGACQRRSKKEPPWRRKKRPLGGCSLLTWSLVLSGAPPGGPTATVTVSLPTTSTNGQPLVVQRSAVETVAPAVNTGDVRTEVASRP